MSTKKHGKLRAFSTFLIQFSTGTNRKDILALLSMIGILLGLIVAFSIAFRYLMFYEGQRHSWISGFYWTLSTMSTLGFGDITFTSDVGRAFSIVVLVSGVVFLLVLLPFTFIEFFYEPWIDARAQSSVPRSVPNDMRGHVILTFYGPVASVLIAKLTQFNYPYVVVLPELAEALRLGNEGIRAVHGELDDPETYRRIGVERAALVATTRADIVNTNVVFTVRGITSTTPIVATAREDASAEILKLAGCSRVLNLTELMAQALARRAIGGDKLTHVVGRIDDLLIAEIDASRTSLVGKTLLEARRITGVSVVGIWARGNFEIAQPESEIQPATVLVIAGSTKQLKAFDETCRDKNQPTIDAPVVIIGGGRVGRVTALALTRRGIDYRIVEQLPERIRDPDKYVLGSGTDKAVLERAGIERAATVIITTRDDQMNIHLTIYCRLLRPDIQIISRSTLERNVAPLHRAGSDFVMSYASMGSNALFNLLQRSDVLMIAEGLDVFKVDVPKQLVGKTIADANIRRLTGCNVIGIDSHEHTLTNPQPDLVFPEDGQIVLIGTPTGESEFLKHFPS